MKSPRVAGGLDLKYTVRTHFHTLTVFAFALAHSNCSRCNVGARGLAGAAEAAPRLPNRLSVGPSMSAGRNLSIDLHYYSSRNSYHVDSTWSFPSQVFPTLSQQRFRPMRLSRGSDA